MASEVQGDFRGVWGSGSSFEIPAWTVGTSNGDGLLLELFHVE